LQNYIILKIRFKRVVTLQIKIKCTKCNLSKTRHNIVIGRGNIPTKILFLGEAPGESEDVLGMPFIGASGKLLDKIFILANIQNFYITNCILCRPITEDGKNRIPDSIEILLCRENILSIINKVNPSKICFIGKTAETYYKKDFPDSFSIVHPAFILRQGGENSNLFKQTIKILKENYEIETKNMD
jgi:uracil-DNA glycosylase family 4